MKSQTITEVEPQFEKEIDPFQQQFQQLFQQQVVSQTFDVPESQIQLSIEDEGCCGRFCNDSTQILNEILTGNVNTLKLNVEKLYGSNKYNTIGLINEAPGSYNREEIDEMLDKKLNISDQIDAYTKQEDDALLLLKDDKSELIDAYSKTEDDELLALKLNISDQTYAYTKYEVDALLDDKFNISEQVDAYSKTEVDELQAKKFNISDQIDAFNKTEADVLLDNKLNISDQIDAYSKTEDDALQLLKANKTELIDAYSKTEANALLDDKLNITDQIDAYNKQEDDALLLLKAYKTKLADYVKLTSAQAITGQKQFNSNVNAAAFAKTDKNDASILLVGGDDILVSSLVSQPQLQEDRDITSDKQVMDYWWDGSSLRALETELPDMSNVMTILGAATGGGNAITDLSFDGNIPIPAKNNTFIMTNFDQIITDQKTFNTTIHSVGITVQNYNKNSVVCAGGGVKTIQDINASIQDDALLLLKADKTQLIDAYSKTDVDALLDDKLNVSDQIDAYTKGNDHALLQLKVDKTQLIDAYTKIETNNLFNSKVDSDASYPKGEDDAQLLLKADKTQLIDAYTKIETNNLLDDKLNVSEQIDAYTKGNDHALLLLKANQSTTYIKIEIDYFISKIEVDDVDLSGYMTLDTAQTITANKTFDNACRFKSSIDGMFSITRSSFVKSGSDDSIVLLGAGGSKPIFEFSNSVDDSNYVKKDGDVQDIQVILRKSTLDQPYPEPTDDDDYTTLGAVKSEFVSSIYSGSINGNLTATSFKNSSKDDSSVLLARDENVLSSFGELLDAADLSDFPELYAFIKERYLKPLEQYPQSIPIGEQTLQQQVKNYDEIIYGSGDSNEEFEPSDPNAIAKLDLNSQLERQSFLVSSGSDPQLIVYNDRITLTASFATI
ncbi:MAG: hypothetical protein EZS28_000284 [Streblomastix strix]|uniref:Uncharacterized protein n=1 Tax=Streblomastix strix TaxID=222440 RepID=A0A5J4XC91_9EUKA|nr:MAG: hypothetical protein EZS28_000284 [Streblomastix strix]